MYIIQRGFPWVAFFCMERAVLDLSSIVVKTGTVLVMSMIVEKVALVMERHRRSQRIHVHTVTKHTSV